MVQAIKRDEVYIEPEGIYVETHQPERRSRKPPLLLVHGALTGSWLWSSFAAYVAERGWEAHAIVVRLGERATTCAEAGDVMDRAITRHRKAFVDAMALDGDRERLAQATTYLEAHQNRYRELEARMVALAERCAEDASVQAAFRRMESP
ncbi:MAG: hypothetical protein H0T79_02360 [Deltaproteobacteria bacterium]|nr:hypothetical protein [Deltaproteobacteria bacterium]